MAFAAHAVLDRRGLRQERRRLSILGSPRWQGLSRIIGAVDALAIAAAMTVAQLSSFGTRVDASVAGTGSIATPYWLLSVALAAAWWILLRMIKSDEVGILGSGVEEYKRVVTSSFVLFGGLAILSYALNVGTGRAYVAVALPLGLLLLLVGRWVTRTYIAWERSRGRLLRKLLLVGSPPSVQHLYDTLSSVPEAGYEPVGAVLPGFQISSPNGPEMPLTILSVSPYVDEIVSAAEAAGVDAIAVTSGARLHPTVVQQLGWEMSDRGISLILAPALTDIAGPRIHTQPVAGLPLIHVATPRLEGGRALSKRVFDIFGAGIALVLLSPALALIALLVKLDSPGPVLFHQERIGKDGVPFRMHKFRSMVPGAEHRLEELMEQNGGASAFFKVKEDPRITRFGAFIRKFSIDELPQLWNVLVGNMSMVGPRPQVRAEVDTYEKYDHRRLTVKPGITGLWQVSGRNDLSVADSIRLDLYYVENWSLTQDFVILLKTVRAVFAKDGAY